MTKERALFILHQRCKNNTEAKEALGFLKKSITQKSGHWIKKDYWELLPFDVSPLDWDNYDEKTHSVKVSHWYCSVCDADYGIAVPTKKYCADCGAKMESDTSHTETKAK